MNSRGGQPPIGLTRRYFTDDLGRSWWIERMGRLDEKTVFWIGGRGYEPSAFASHHDREADFTASELTAALEHLSIRLP